MNVRLPLTGLALAANSFAVGSAIEALPVAAAQVCTYEVQPGAGIWRIEHDTGLDAANIAREMGTTVDKLPMAHKILDICLDNSVDDERSPVASTKTVTVSASECPTKVTSSAEISKACRATAAQLIKEAGYYNPQAYQQANGITSYSNQSPSVGVKTYNLAMSGAKLNVTSPDLRDHVVVDISDQIAIFYSEGKAAVISRASTGSGKDYTYTDKAGNTQNSTAVTRLGTSKIYAARDANYRSADLGGAIGSMAYALPFNGGIALHSGNLPGYPASHGCVRLERGNAADPTDDAIKLMRDKGLGIGDRVTVQK